MTKEYMAGTPDDVPMLKVTLNNVVYFVEEDKGEVFLDQPGLPRVTDAATVAAVLEAAKAVS